MIVTSGCLKNRLNIQLITHRGRQWIALRDTDDTALTILRNKKSRYSKTCKAWLLPDKRENRDFCRLLYHQQKKMPARVQMITDMADKIKPVLVSIHPVNLAHLNRCRQELILKAYSPSTQKTYLSEINSFLQWCAAEDAMLITIDRLRGYFETLLIDGYSYNLVYSRLNAVKFFYEQVLKGKGFWVDLPRPKKGFQLPHFFSAAEVAAILNHTQNLKHKTMLAVCYGSGLRVSELVKLKVMDIMGDRRYIVVKNGKGRKERLVTLSAVVLILLREYYKTYRPDRNGYLFTGQYPGQPYSVRSIQLVLQAAKQKAGILKPGAIHALRHSFATHLLDKGTDISMIQKLLGHNDIKTTLRYLHTSHKDLILIVSPIEHININLPKSLPGK